jgi:hypothetical protein
MSIPCYDRLAARFLVVVSTKNSIRLWNQQEVVFPRLGFRWDLCDIVLSVTRNVVNGSRANL